MKIPEFTFPVIPAEAGIQYFQQVQDSSFRGSDAMLTFYELINPEPWTAEL